MPAEVLIRSANRPGDLGWVIMAHGELYAQEYGWNSDFEALVAQVVAEYAADHDPATEGGWIAEVSGRRAGCIFCVADRDATEKVAKLRILLVDPTARGHGVGGLLVDTCLQFARTAGYAKIILWTNNVLSSARRIYQSRGFELTEEAPHHSFGHDLVGQTWTLRLTRSDPGSPAVDGDRHR